MFTLTDIYEQGLGVSADPNAALAWAIASAEAGHPGAPWHYSSEFTKRRAARR